MPYIDAVPAEPLPAGDTGTGRDQNSLESQTERVVAAWQLPVSAAWSFVWLGRPGSVCLVWRCLRPFGSP